MEVKKLKFLLLLVESIGLDSRRELRGLVVDGSNSPPDCYSAPSLFEQLVCVTNRVPFTFGGKYRARTYDPLLVRQMLSQLS